MGINLHKYIVLNYNYASKPRIKWIDIGFGMTWFTAYRWLPTVEQIEYRERGVRDSEKNKKTGERVETIKLLIDLRHFRS